jgi:hypothetical protein
VARRGLIFLCWRCNLQCNCHRRRRSPEPQVWSMSAAASRAPGQWARVSGSECAPVACAGVHKRVWWGEHRAEGAPGKTTAQGNMGSWWRPMREACGHCRVHATGLRHSVRARASTPRSPATPPALCECSLRRCPKWSLRCDCIHRVASVLGASAAAPSVARLKTGFVGAWCTWCPAVAATACCRHLDEMPRAAANATRRHATSEIPGEDSLRARRGSQGNPG